MKGIDILSVISGVVLTVGGVALLLASILLPFLVIYGVVALVLGIIILVTLRKQEYIEPIRERNINYNKYKRK